MLHIKLNGITKCSKIVANIMHATIFPLRLRVERSKFNFSEHGIVAYQLKLNHECSNIVVFCLLADPTPTFTLGIGIIGLKSTFSEHGRFSFIKFKGITNCKPHDGKYFALPPRPLGSRSKGQKSTFSQHCHVAYPIKRNNERSFACRTPPTLGMDGVNRSKFNYFSEHGHVAYQIIWNYEMQQHGSKYFFFADPHPPRP